MEMGAELDAQSIVRSYSLEVERRLAEDGHSRNLAQALVTERGYLSLNDGTAPWRAFFEPSTIGTGTMDPITKIVQTESANLREKWVKFWAKSPNDERLDLHTSDPTVQGVVAMVDAVTMAWQDKRKRGHGGKAKTLFHKFCGTLESHSSLIKLLPDGNEYVSVFTGTLNAIIKASANHEAIAEGFAEGLCTISEHIEEVDRHLKLLPIDDVIKLIADLYEHVFLFLSSVMDWIMKKRTRRLLDSFRENFSEQFANEVKRINEKAARIRNIASQSSMAEGRVTRLLTERIDRDIRLGLEGQRRHQAEMLMYAERLDDRLKKAEEDSRLERERMKNLGGSVVILLESDAAEWLQARAKVLNAAPAVGSVLSFQQLLAVPTSPAVGDIVDAHPAQDVALNSRHLEDSFSRERIRISTDSFSPTTVTSDLVIRLSEWAQGLHSFILWLDGPATEMDELESPLTNLAAKFIDLASTNNLHVVSYFCEIPRTVPEGATREIKGAISLLYALLRQMVEILLPRLETDVDLSEERFLGLDGTMDSWPEALTVLRDLMGLTPGIVYCVIDGFHLLDDETTDEPLEQLLEILRGGRLRVLFTTAGRSGCLLSILEPEETFVVGDTTADDVVDGLDDQDVLFR
ncbi:hypothetical protein VPNG_01369 [Cytospora leucostoma]|uniref:DUF7708 domain-containing protein n=1 Tax=Cytospora leucostoma TaxID=1230097 RepID=A0A423XLG3_9PEZI|nr:hypothetical protein VPNG_01369 [Cytospora leucostoma]